MACYRDSFTFFLPSLKEITFHDRVKAGRRQEAILRFRSWAYDYETSTEKENIVCYETLPKTLK
jgi:hypothetical protein